MRTAILPISDKGSRGEREDKSGAAIREIVEEMGAEVVEHDIVADERGHIELALRRLAQSADLVLTTGGTGIAPRDVTPEATRAVIDKELPGITEIMRLKSLDITPTAMLSRGTAGLRGRTLVVNLPGNPRGAVECLEIVWPVLEHAVDMIQGHGHSEETRGHDAAAEHTD